MMATITKKPPLRFVELATELQLKILSQLPAREIQMARRVSRHFREMIDLEENWSLLLSTSTSTSLDRLKTFANRYIEFPVDRARNGLNAFLNAIFDFADVKGLRCTSNAVASDRIANVNVLCELFSAFWLRQSRGYRSATRVLWLEPLLKPTVYSVLWWHWYTNDFDPRFESVTHGEVDDADYFISALGTKYGVERDSMFDEIASRSRSKEYRDPDTLQHPVIEPLRFLAGRSNDGRRQCLKNLRDVLQVPQLPEEAPYTFYVKTIRAKREVVEAMDKSRVITGLKRAAILEELFIN